jgi:O-antigen/teichoic acid export membrane protein
MSIRRHSFYNLAGSLASIAVTLLTVPIYLQMIGAERYGVLVIVWIFLGYFGVFDLGLGRATAQRIATLHQADPGERADTFWTALMLNTVFGVVGGLLLWPVARYFFANHFQVSEVLRLEVLAAVPWVAAAVPVATVSGVLYGALQGRERFLALNATSVLGAALYQILPLMVAWMYGPDLAWLVPAALLGRVVTFVLLFAQCYRHVPLNMASSVRRDLVAPLFRYGGWVTVSGIIGPLLTTLDRFLIGSISGAKALTYYAVPFNLASRVIVLPGSLSDTLFPRFSSTSKEERHRLMDEAVRSLSVILTPLIIAGILIMEPFLTWWVGSEVARNSAFVGEIIALGMWFNGLAYLPFARLQAQGRPDLCAKCHLAELIPYLVFLTLALQAWGVVGAALAWSLRVSVDAMLLFWMDGDAPRGIMTHLPPLLLLGIATAAVFGFPLGSVSRWVVGASAFLGSLAWAWWTAPDSVKRLVRDGYQMLPRTHKA